MKYKFSYILPLISGIVVLFSCKPKDIVNEPDAGEIDPTVYVSVGGSMSAGFMDDALSYDGQTNSVSSIFAEQLALVGSTGFTQPFVQESSVGINLNGLSKLILGYKTDCEGTSSLSPVRLAVEGDLSIFSTNVYSSPFRNMGIPGLKSTELNIAGYGNPANGPGNYNPFFARMASDQVNATVMSNISANNATFFSIFIGLDEVLEYAKSGATAGVLTPVNGGVGVGFSGSMEELVINLTANGAKGVLSTIPDVTEMPYFTTIPYDGLELDAESAESLNQIYNPIGINFTVGKNPFVIEDPDAGAFGVRLLEEGEQILLSVPLDSVKCFKMGSVFPFRNEFILTNEEKAEIQAAVSGYNNVIVQLSQTYSLAVADSYAFYKKITNGFVYNGISISAGFVSGGAYSLDGINLNPKLNALLANEFIRATNEKYQAKIPYADPLKYRGILFP